MAPSISSTPRKPVKGQRVGFYGCYSGGGSLVRLGLPEGVERAPRSILIARCPACDGGHRTTAIWHRPEPRDEGLEPEVVVGVDGLQVLDEEGGTLRLAPVPSRLSASKSGPPRCSNTIDGPDHRRYRSYG